MAAKKKNSAKKSSGLALSGAKSSESLGSMGIGPTEPSIRLKFIPDGLTNVDERLYDCILALIFCPEHRQVAVINTRRESIIWTPFLQLREGQSWKEGAIDCVQQAIGRQDAELNQADSAKQAPTFDLAYLEITQVQVPSPSPGSIVRITLLATLKRGSPFKCCTKDHQIDWVPLGTLLTQYGHHWGPELHLWATQLDRSLTLLEPLPPVMSGLTLAASLGLFAPSQKDTAEFKATKAIRLRASHAIEIYEEYLKHCYPSLYMKFDSFRLFLAKHAFPSRPSLKRSPSGKVPANKESEEELLKWTRMYDLCRVKGKEWIDFSELLCCMMVMDPHCKDKVELRVQYLFRFYTKGKGAFAEDDLRRLGKHLWPQAPATEVVPKLYRALAVSPPEKVKYPEFLKAINSRALDVSTLLRFERSVLVANSPTFGRTKAPKTADLKNIVLTHQDLGDKCFSCRKKAYEYGVHVVTIGDSGCTKQGIIDRGWLKNAAYPPQRAHSLNYTFPNSSINNFFLDLVRTFNRSRGHPGSPKGLMSGKEDTVRFTTLLKRLCRTLNGILLAEPKLLRLNGPALIAGDLQGHLDGLLAMEDALFTNFPILPETLLFLGNYSGHYPFGVEVLVYLFALKIAQPNKVYLLRGMAETCSSAGSHALRAECTDKYGREKGGLVYQTLNEVFAKLPLAAVVDESILAVHSGIPKKCIKMSELMGKLPASIANLPKEAPAAYELLTTYPLSYKHLGGNSLNTVDDDLLSFKTGDPVFHPEERSQTVQEVSVKSMDTVRVGKGKGTPLPTSFSEGSLRSLKTNGGKKAKVPSTSSVAKAVKMKGKFTRTPAKAARTSPRTSPRSKYSGKGVGEAGKGTIQEGEERSPRDADPGYNPDCPPAAYTVESSFRTSQQTFDGRAFVDFMTANSYRYLIRSSSICQSGFKRNFNDRCLTIFSCGNIADYANKPAVLLLDRTMATMRLVTFNVPEPKVAKLMITCTIMDLDAMKKRSSRETLSKK